MIYVFSFTESSKKIATRKTIKQNDVNTNGTVHCFANANKKNLLTQLSSIVSSSSPSSLSNDDNLKHDEIVDDNNNAQLDLNENEDQNECFETNQLLKQQQQQFGKLNFDDDNDYDDEENNENVDDSNCSRLIKNFEELNLNLHLTARNDNVKNQQKLSNDDEDYDIENEEEDNSSSLVNISSSVSSENSLSPSPPPVPARRYQNHSQILSSMSSAAMIKNGEQFDPKFSDNADKNNSIGRSLRTSYSTGSVRSLLARKLNRTIGNNGSKSSLTNGL